MFLGKRCRGRLVHFAPPVAGCVCSAADVPASPLSESQNRLLNDELDANNIGGHAENEILKSGEAPPPMNPFRTK